MKRIEKKHQNFYTIAAYKQIDSEIELETLYAKQAAAHENVSSAKNTGCTLLIILFCVSIFLIVTKIFK